MKININTRSKEDFCSIMELALSIMAQKMTIKKSLKWRSTTTIVILYIISCKISQVHPAAAIRQARNANGRAKHEVPPSFYTIDRFDYENDDERKPPMPLPERNSTDRQQRRLASKLPPYDFQARSSNSSEARNLLPLNNMTRSRQPDYPYQRSQINLNDTLASAGPLREPYELQSKQYNKKKKLKLNRENELSSERADTVSALIEVLDAANRRLLEQRKSLSDSDIEVTMPKRASNLSKSHYDDVDERDRGEFLAANKPVDLYQQHAAASNIVGQSSESKHLAAMTTSKPKTKKKKKKFKKKSSNLNSELDKRENSTRIDGDSRKQHIESDGKRSKSEAADHNLVKPGFQPEDSIIGDGSDLLMRRRAQHPYPPNLALDPLGGGLTLVPAKEQSGEYAGQPLTPAHQPIVAKDLLHVSRPQLKSQDPRYFVKHGGVEDGAAESPHLMNTPRRRYPELVPYHEQGAPYEENQMGGPLYESAMPYSRPRFPGGSTPVPHRMLGNQLDDPYEQMPLGHRLSTQLPETHPLTGTTTTHQPPIEQQNQHQQSPYSTGRPNRLDWRPLVGPDGAGDPSHPLNRPHLSGAVYGDPHDMSPPQQQILDPLLVGLGNGGGDGPANELNNRLGDHPQQQQPQHPGLANPLQHLLMAAKDQQAAALDYERRRLNYELALRNREHQMRAHHENNLERQRQAAQQNQAELTKKQQQEQQAGRQQQQNQQPQNAANREQEVNINEQQNDNQQGEVENHEQGDQGGGDGDGDQNEQQGNGGQDDSDMKNFQSFAGADTDFTDLFPPGILSDAEIKEMRKQQEDQKRSEEQEERERQQQQGEEEAPAGSREQENAGQEEQQQVNSNQRGESQAPSEETKATPSDTVRLQPAALDAKGTGSSKANDTQAVAGDKQQVDKAADNQLPSFLFANATATKPEPIEQAVNTTKVRRSNLLPAPLLVLDSEFQERYMKSFMDSHNNDRQASSSETPASQHRGRNSQTNRNDFESNREWHETRASDKLPRPLIDFDDIIESFESSGQR